MLQEGGTSSKKRKLSSPLVVEDGKCRSQSLLEKQKY